ncbi:50S ribosomal protein L3 N(5)-glutamine methyltransferase [Limnohabitans sp. Rim8]|uniref:50S ribosomal protein L3 N(5)-glutamine methyltransferase n=1 Tax=Limnohabitans sp. Rim8 TaxID=1100718 RepID=UPI0026197A19|nr:50S ribosomal protein L3 N(5)-glutamine methyltransferase [Limnohabitans sp. Rim8]
MTLTELIAASTTQLSAAFVSYGHGTDNAHDEATWLILWKLGLPLDSDTEAFTRALTSDEISSVCALVQHRITTCKPTAYLTQEAWLQGVPFYIDERSIVPRSFIAELLADGGFDYWLGDQTQRVLDLCTGNGSLAVLAAMTYPYVTVVGADISPDALAVARINVDRHLMHKRITLIESDGLHNLPGVFDLILCNPPYVCASSMQALPAEFLAEPELALAGGEDGMDFIRQLLTDAPTHMSDKAVLVLEIGNEREHFEKAFPQLEVIWLETTAGEDQVMLITRQTLISLAH